MKLMDQIVAMRKRLPPGGVTWPQGASFSKDDVKSQAENSLRQHMKSTGASDADVDAYLNASAGPQRARIAA